jgi:hypothetical protein
MAINYVKGQILADNLERDGIDLAFNTDLVYLDVGADRVGINTTTPVSTLEIVGNISVGNIVIPNIGNVSLANVNINNLAEPVVNSDAATKYYVDQNVGNIGSAGNLTFSNTTISTSLANGNITLAATGSEFVIIAGPSGFVVPVGNTAQRPTSPAVGTLRFNSLTKNLEVWDGTEWDLGSSSIITNQTINPDGSTATYTLDQEATADGILVSINGIAQTPQVDYIVTGADQITFTTTPLPTDIIQIRFIASTYTVSALTNNYGNSSVQVTETPEIIFEINGANVATITANAVFDLAGCQSLQLPIYDVANAQALSNVSDGEMIYVSNGDSGNPCLAVYSGGGFRRISFGANISI